MKPRVGDAKERTSTRMNRPQNAERREETALAVSAPLQRLAGRVAVITGGGTGIGSACVKQFSSAGADVVINYSRSGEEAERTLAEAESKGIRARAFRADVSDDAAVRAMIRDAVASYGRIDFLVNSAGVTRFVDEE